MKDTIRRHINDITSELRLINKEIKKLRLKQLLLKRKIKMFNKVINMTDETE